MTAWAQSLIRLTNYEVETLQKRMAEIAARRADAEMKLVMLDAEAEGEKAQATADPQHAAMLRAYLNGWKLRRANAEGMVEALLREEEGARDALTAAFEELKKFEHVAETTRVNKRIEANRREAATFDEMGLRRRNAG
ncbi:flagellar FliJ family protein [Brevundimonas pishanensis]|uniref:flagellar FliJ family protein n=1 Tax=Brevundimonas pishanensis TaxID=2896315 RepID=UPI001FA808DB|nr:flagellar FliJ family protein [Brevundimonas pishanensis]